MSINATGHTIISSADFADPPSPEDVLFSKLTLVGTTLYYTSTSTTKLSILFMYKRLFAVNGLFHRRFWILAIVLMGFWLGTTIANLCSCVPLHEFWMPRDPASCFNFNVFWLVAGILEAILDVIILVLPLRIVYGLKLSKRKKIALVGVFLFGAL